MNAWATFWGIVLIVALVIFALLAIVIAIGGLSDVKSLFASIEAQHDEQEES